MTDRFVQVELLLRSVNDLRFEPVSWSGSLRRQAIAGEGPSERLECASCGGEGVRRERGVPVPCEACGGRRGVLSSVGKPGRGWIYVDSYTQRPIGSSETGTSRASRAVRCDACGGDGAFGNGRRCGYCRGSGWVEVSLELLRSVRVGGGGFASWEWGPGELLLVEALDVGFAGAGGAFRERVAAGSYEELSAGLVELARVDRSRYRLVSRVYVDGLLEPEELDDRDSGLLRDGLGFLVVRMPEVIRVPGWAARNERRRRDRLKRKLVAA